VSISYLFSVLFAVSVVLYSFIANLNWSGIQIFAAAWLAWDFGGGVIGYSHKAIKQQVSKKQNNLHFFHHNLVHTHPLILIFFNNEPILFGLTIFSIVSFFLYVELLEVNPKTGIRKITEKGEKTVIIFEIIVATALVIVSFLVENIPYNFQLFGIVVYGSLIIFTIILINIPLSFQRTSSIMFVISMIIVGMFISVPNGFEWFIPVYFLKLLAGYTAKEEIIEYEK